MATYKEIIDLTRTDGLPVAVQHLINLHDMSSIDPRPSRTAYSYIIKNIMKQFSNVQKSKSRLSSECYSAFMDQPVVFPKVKPVQKQHHKSADSNTSDTYAVVAHNLAKELHQVQEEKMLVTCKYQKLKKVKASKKLLKKYRTKLKEKNKELLQQKKFHMKEALYLKKKISQRGASLKRSYSKMSYLTAQKVKLQQKHETVQKQLDTINSECSEVHDQLNASTNETKDTLDENNWLREMVQEEVTTKFPNGQYTDDMKECVMSLLTHNVPTGQVSAVISAVMKLACRKASDLPSKSTVNDWNVMRLILAQKQIGEILPSQSNLGLLSDETSKFGKKVEGFHASDSDGRLYVLGLREITTKSGQDTLSTFQQILRDIDDVSHNATDVAKKILVNITCTMSDRASTQIKFNELLEAYRQEVLPSTIENYAQLTDAQRLSLGKLCNFFCGLHALVHLAEVASTALKESDKGFFADKSPILDGSFSKGNESGAVRLIRTASKAVAQGGDEKSGCHGSYMEYMRPHLKANGFYSLPLEPFRGNRFNIVFQNAASLFYLAEHLTSFLNGNATNRLLQAVLFDLKVPEYLAGCKALGLISKLVTVPLWTTIENTAIHLMDIGTRYQEIIDYLVTAVERTDEFITGTLHLSFSETGKLENDKIYGALIKTWEHDHQVETILKVMLPAMTSLLQRIFSDHLEGGRWSEVSQELREKTKGLPKHNKFSESIFGHLDRLLREKPSLTTIASEAYVMFSHNNTLEWLQSKTTAERATLISQSRKSVKHTRKAFKTRQLAIQEAKRVAVLEKLRKAEAAQLAKLRKKEQQTTNIIHWGLWQSDQEVNDALRDIDSEKEKVKALKDQLNFRRNVLKQKPLDPALKNVYSFSHRVEKRRVTLDSDGLAGQVKQLIAHSFQLDATEQQPRVQEGGAPILVGRKVSHKFVTDDGDEWFNGTVISQVAS